LPDEIIVKLNSFLDDKNAERINLNSLLSALTHYKELMLAKEEEDGDSDFLDAFIALGGHADKSGAVSKEDLISIIKDVFELTIDLENMLRKMGGDID